MCIRKFLSVLSACAHREWNLSPFYTHVSRKVISVFEISAVNFTVG